MFEGKFTRFIIFPLLLIAAVSTMYLGVLQNKFSGLDDLLMIEENWDNLTHFSHIYTAFTNDVFNGVQGTYYRPIQILSYMPDAFITQSATPDPHIFMIVNLVLFVIAIVGLYLFLGMFGFSAGYRFVFSLMFGLHPALTPAVAWIPGRVDTVLFILALISIASYIQSKKGSSFWLILSVFSYALALFNKETAIAIPAIIMAYEFSFQNRWEKTSWRWIELFQSQFWLDLFSETWEWVKQSKTLVISWIIVTVLFLILRHNALPDNPFGVLSILSKIAYSWKPMVVLTNVILLPFHFQVFLEVTWWYFILSIPGFLLILVLPRLMKTSFQLVLFGAFWMFLFIFPTTISNLLNYHRLFLPMVGMAFLFAPLDHLKSLKWKLGTGIAIIGLLAIFINENLHFQKSFVDRKSFWSNAYLFSPNSILANGGMAWTYHMNHQNDSAMYFYSRMIELEPERDQTRLGMAIIAEEMGDYEITDSLIVEEFKVTKDSANVYYYIGQILLERGDTIGAVKNLNLGKEVVLYSRNARTYFDTLDIQVRNQIELPD